VVYCEVRDIENFNGRINLDLLKMQVEDVLIHMINKVLVGGTRFESFKYVSHWTL